MEDVCVRRVKTHCIFFLLTHALKTVTFLLQCESVQIFSFIIYMSNLHGVAFKHSQLRDLSLTNIGAIEKRADLSKKLSVLLPEEIRDLVCNKVSFSS